MVPYFHTSRFFPPQSVPHTYAGPFTIAARCSSFSSTSPVLHGSHRPRCLVRSSLRASGGPPPQLAAQRGGYPCYLVRFAVRCSSSFLRLRGWVPAPEFRDAVGPPSLPLPLSLPAWWRASLGAASSWCSACAQRNPSCLFLVGVSGSARQRYLPAHRHLLLLLPLMPPPLDPLSLADGGWSVCSLRQPAHLLWFLCSRIPADGGRMSRGAAVGGLHRVPACSARLRFGYPTLILFFTHPRTEQGMNR